ncbi:hypothetical protein BDN70DRAFT_928469 [Pholiota conissans]|uniref:Uncharacterized protein n=1 Tax=Pholiota conissans TaxID=109636 RepID=A0A9P6D5Y0_9AGAR|nr:hypothetical protein BDN70DRAFT_928469 [Pholiota conissans]
MSNEAEEYSKLITQLVFFLERNGIIDIVDIFDEGEITRYKPFQQIKVEQEAIEYVRQKFAPWDNPVFQLVPEPFAQYTRCKALYGSMGSPTVNCKNI